MKHFLSGLLGGTLVGVAASFLRDKNGKRLGEPVKDNLAAAAKELRKLKTSCQHVHRAIGELAQSLPAAEKSLNEIKSEVQNFQVHSQSRLAEIERQSKHLSAKLTAKTKKN